MHFIDENMPRISIVIPTLNQGKFIQQTINSIINQEYPDLEIVVIDGGSMDITIDILRSFGNRITWISEKDEGQSDAINKGLRKCTGQICGFINSDDYLLPGSLKCIANAFQHENVQWITGDYVIVDAEGKPIQHLVSAFKNLLRRFSSRTLLLCTNYIVQPSTFWRRTLMDKIGFFNQNLHFTMDYDYWLKAFTVTTPHIMPQKLSAFRIHPNSKGGKQYILQFDEELSVVTTHTQNNKIIKLHKMLNVCIVGIYKIIK